MSVASYPILKFKPRTKFYHSFFLMFSYTFMGQANEIICIFIIGLNFYLVSWLVVQDIWQLKYRLCCRSNHFSFLLFLTYSFYVFINIREYKNWILRIPIVIGSHTCISTMIWYQVL